MSDGTGKGFMMSATLHGSIALALFIFGYVLKRDPSELPKVFELVAGEGDNFMATEAPALGSPGGVKIDVPKAPEPKPAPPEPVVQEAPPVIPTPPPPKPPTPKAVTPPEKSVEKPVPSFKDQIVRKVIIEESKAKMQLKREKAAEKKRLDEEKKKMSKEEFDRANAGKSTVKVAKNTTPNVKKVDAEGIAKGVVGGSTKNKVGGAGGKALTNDNTDVLAAYDKFFKDELRRKFEPPPGLGESLKGTFEVRSNADGTFTSARVVKSSGSREFDQAVLDAIRRVKLPPRPDKKSETVEFDFNMRDRPE